MAPPAAICIMFAFVTAFSICISCFRMLSADGPAFQSPLRVAENRGASAVAVRASTSGMPAFMRRLKSANSADKSLLFPSEGAAACTRPARWRKGCGRPLCDGLPHTALRRAETRAAAQRAAILL